MDKCKIRELWFQVNTLRRAALRPYFQEIGLTVGQGQPRILNSLRKYGLTEEGRKKAVQVQHIFEKGDEIWWKSFDEEELERLYQYLLKMEQSLKGDQGK